jgi:3-oxoacyl-[acyl-carrier protein] reductase
MSGAEHREEWAVILGATGGSGASAARALCQDPGLNIFGVHRGTFPDVAEEIGATVTAAGRRCHLRRSGAGRASEAREGAEELLRIAGKHSVRVFVHAIADGSYGCFAESFRGQLHEKQLHKTFDAMAHSFVYWTQELLRLELLAPGARLIGLANYVVDSVVRGWGLVAASKAALEIYIRHLAAELGPQGYRVSFLKFGMIETRAIQMAFSEKEWARLKGEIEALTPARRLIHPDEVARFLVQLTGEVGEWFNGATIDMTGGQVQSLLDPIVNPRKKEKKS